MATALFHPPRCRDHDTGGGHPERPQRLDVVRAALQAPAFKALAHGQGRAATREELALIHSRAHIESLSAAFPVRGRGEVSGGTPVHVRLDADTVMSEASFEAALLAAGAVMAAVDGVLEGTFRNAFCAVRPPGHHAESDHAMGFCLFNNVAVAARNALARHKLKRVAVLDFDAHHGNGTQHVFSKDSRLFYGSTHQYPFYPGSGASGERGVGNIVNAPLPAGSGGEAFLAAWRRILEAVDEFAPQLILLSAGFDAHRRDPLAQLMVEEEDFRTLTFMFLEAASRHCRGRLVSVLEGGYNLKALASSVAVHVGALMAESPSS